MCKMFSSSGKPLSSGAESSDKEYNKITPLLPKIKDLYSSPKSNLTRKDLNRPHIWPSFPATALASRKICDTSCVSFVEKSVVSFFYCFVTMKDWTISLLMCIPSFNMQYSSWHEVYAFFNLKLLQCLPLKTFATLTWLQSHSISCFIKILWLLAWWTE